jgi:hypothetical protein
MDLSKAKVVKEGEPLTGGRYVVKDGVRYLVEESTKEHPEGTRAREADGTPIATPDETHANPEPKKEAE